MLHISTGFLQIQVTCANGLFPIPNVRIHLLQKKDSILVYEDFFLADYNGKSQNIALYVEENSTQTYEIMIQDPCFVPIHIICSLYAKIHSKLIINLIPILPYFQETFISETVTYPSFDYLLYAMQNIPPTLTMNEFHQLADDIYNQSNTKPVSYNNWILIHEPVYQMAIDYYAKTKANKNSEDFQTKMKYCLSFLNRQITSHTLYTQFYGFSTGNLQYMQGKINHIYHLLPHDYLYDITSYKNFLTLCGLSLPPTTSDIKRKVFELITLLNKRITLDKRMNSDYLIILDEVLQIYQKKEDSSVKEKIQSFQRLFGLPVTGNLHDLEYSILSEIQKELTEAKKALQQDS